MSPPPSAPTSASPAENGDVAGEVEGAGDERVALVAVDGHAEADVRVAVELGDAPRDRVDRGGEPGELVDHGAGGVEDEEQVQRYGAGDATRPVELEAGDLCRRISGVTGDPEPDRPVGADPQRTGVHQGAAVGTGADGPEDVVSGKDLDRLAQHRATVVADDRDDVADRHVDRSCRDAQSRSSVEVVEVAGEVGVVVDAAGTEPGRRRRRLTRCGAGVAGRDLISRT